MVDVKEEETVVDLLFCVDATGSMRTLIETVLNNIKETVKKIKDDHPDAIVNLGFLAYRDWVDEHKEHPRIQMFPFNQTIEEFERFVGSLKATGGGDYPEDVLGGLWESAGMCWSAPTRILFHIFDAPPHGRDVYHSCPGDMYPRGHPSDKLLVDIFRKFQENNVSYHMMIQGPYLLQQMVEAFDNDAERIGYKINHCPLITDLSKVMAFVGKTVCKTIRLSGKAHPVGVGGRHRVDHPMERASEFKVYCGIDFGTHGSAFATCTARDPAPRAGMFGGSGVSTKTLTNVLLDSKKKLVEGDAGFGLAALEKFLEMDEDEKKRHFFFRRFKMELYKDAVASDERKEGVDIASRLKPQDKSDKPVNTTTVLVQALKFIIGQVMQKVQAEHRRSSPDDEINETDIQWILTVPAIWSQHSRKMMERVAYKSGIPRGEKHDQLIIALEPECACVAVQSEMRLLKDECYMMIDCGGGTVDIACHQMVTNTTVKEIYPPSGGPWGSTYVDDVFWREYLVALFGVRVIQRAETEYPTIKEAVIHNFVTSKIFATPLETTRKVRIDPLMHLIREEYGTPANAIAHLDEVQFPPESGENCGAKLKSNGQLTIDRRIWDYMFDSVINKLIDHVRGLLELPELGDRIQTLCVVGGFAMSPILMDRLSRAFEGPRRVFRPTNPSLSVVMGAAMFGLAPTTIAERCAPKTLGVAVRDLWREGDGEERKVGDAREGSVVDGVFFPFIRAGQAIPRGDERSRVVHYFEPVNLREFVVEIYQSNLPDPRFVPAEPCGVIGPITFPAGFDHNLYDICVEFDFSETTVNVRVWFGEEEARGISIDFFEDS